MVGSWKLGQALNGQSNGRGKIAGETLNGQSNGLRGGNLQEKKVMVIRRLLVLFSHTRHLKF